MQNHWEGADNLQQIFERLKTNGKNTKPLMNTEEWMLFCKSKK
jgi:hypothetical protein